MAVYESHDVEGLEICADCYRLEIKAMRQYGTQCPECQSWKPTYRDPRSGDDRHLCSNCHVQLGHRYQQNGRWVTSIQTDLL